MCFQQEGSEIRHHNKKRANKKKKQRKSKVAATGGANEADGERGELHFASLTDTILLVWFEKARRFLSQPSCGFWT